MNTDLQHALISRLMAVAGGLAVLCAVAMAAEEQPAAAKSEKPNVLILGDSISIGYTPFVQEMMAEQANVVRPMRGKDRPENCSGTTYGVTEIDRWLAIDGKQWDVIHFNWGLHDIKHVKPDGSVSNEKSDPPQADLETYRKNLQEIVNHLKKTNAKLVFATTTPVPEGELKPYRSDADVVAYNNAAKEIMQREGIAVDDLYAFAKPRLNEIQRPVNVHFSDEGSKALAEQVVKSIRKALKSGSNATLK